MPSLTEIPFALDGGYYPNCSVFTPSGLQNTIRAGRNVWLRSGGRVVVANGVAQTAAQNVGARIFQYNTQRATIEGDLVSGRLPYAGLIRYQNAVMLFLSELTSKQVYLNEAAASGVTTSSTAGRLRVALPSWNTYDAGFDPPTLPSGDVTTGTIGTKSMTGSTGVALAAWRTKTNAISAPSNTVVKALDASTANNVYVVLPTAVSGQDGWVMAGTQWGDGASGNVYVIRYIYTTIRGTFTATNGSPNLTAGSDTFFLRDLRPGDIVTIDGGSYTISAITSNTTATLTGNFTGSTGASKTATITTAAADWRNGELGKLLSYDVFKPDRAAGIFTFAQRAFLWGCRGPESTSVTGPTIIPLLPDNPEHIGLTAIVTANGDDLINVLPGETRLYGMTANTLESFTFTGSTDDPYRVRVLHQPGFAAAQNGIIFKDRFYGYSENPIRTTVEDNMDDRFHTPVSSDMRGWTASRVVLLADPKNEAVLYTHYDGSSTTTVIPFLTDLDRWNPPITVSGQIVDSAVINGTLYFTLLTGGNYRVYTWEGGSAGSASSPYVVTQFNDAGASSYRKKIKSLLFSGKGSTLRVYRIGPDGTYPDITNTGAAAHSITLQGTEKAEKQYSRNINNGRLFALRVDLPTGGSIDALSARGYLKENVL